MSFLVVYGGWFTLVDIRHEVRLQRESRFDHLNDRRVWVFTFERAGFSKRLLFVMQLSDELFT